MGTVTFQIRLLRLGIRQRYARGCSARSESFRARSRTSRRSFPRGGGSSVRGARRRGSKDCWIATYLLAILGLVKAGIQRNHSFGWRFGRLPLCSASKIFIFFRKGFHLQKWGAGPRSAARLISFSGHAASRRAGPGVQKLTARLSDGSSTRTMATRGIKFCAGSYPPGRLPSERAVEKLAESGGIGYPEAGLGGSDAYLDGQ
jgi:hypothetical protein